MAGGPRRRFGRASAVWAVACGLALAGGAAGAESAVPIRISPALPALGEVIEVQVDVTSRFPLAGAPAVVKGDGRIVLDVRQDMSQPGAARMQTVRFTIPGLAPPGFYLAAATLDGAPYAELAFTLRPATALLDLVGARFQVAVDRPAPGGAAARAVRLSDASGFFWFYDAANPELTVKIVDGRAVNGHYWIFIASMTDVAQTVTVTDLGSGCKPVSACPARTYVNPPHGNRNFVDVEAFGGAPRIAADLSFLDLAVISPALPSRLDPVRVVVNGIGAVAASFAPPSIDGAGITLVGVTPGGPAPPGAPGRWTTAIDLGTLAPGSYTLEVILDGFEYLTQAFAVREAASGLALTGGRFLVSVSRPGAGAAGSPAASAVSDAAAEILGSAVAVSDAAGYFWFFDSADLELTVKILDGRPVDGHYWVFIASMTDQPYTVTVADTAGGCAPAPAAPSPCPTRRYVNPAHRNQNFIDVGAF
jgi:hypothetical protein